jgi:PAS domain S-box-containing protein
MIKSIEYGLREGYFMFFKECFQSIVENINEAVIGVDNTGIIFVINKMAEKLLGIDAESGLGLHIEEIIPETNLPRVLKNCENEINQNFLTNGREFITNRIVIMSENKPKGAIAIFRDITNHKKMQEELNADKSYIDILDTIINTFNEWIVVTDEKGIITMMSKAYKEFVDCANPEGKLVDEVIENTRMSKVIESGVAEIGEVQEIKGNKMIAMRVPLKKDDKVIGAIGKVVFKDISDFHSLSKKLNNLEKEVEFYKNELDKERKAKYSVENIVGDSAKVKEVKSLVKKVANTNSNVLIIGESGTGKELFAHSIHNASKRYLAPFVKINCAAIPSELLEAELFGYEEGAFTGAKKGGKKGKFELANGGTIFLDEIGDMPMNMQVKLLRVIQEKEIERVGGNTLKSINVRIIAATNKDLENSIKEGKFREDLYYRLNVMKISIPPLRERKEDIPKLVNALRIKVANRLGIYVEGISKDALECLVNYDWPGNIRELENVIERAINLLDSDIVIKLEHLSERLTKNKFKRYSSKSKYLKVIVEEVEKEVILECLKETNWNKNKAAKILGISRAGLYKKIEEYKLESLT